MIRGFLQRWLKKESAVGGMIAAFSLGRAVFPKRDFANFAKEAYQLNVIAFRCIELISSSAASVPWLLYRDDKEITEHPLLTLLRRPNPMQSGKELWEAVYSYDLLTGNSYTERVMVGGGNRVHELHTHRPDRMKIIPGTFGLPSAFEYTVNAQKKPFTVDPRNGRSDILHVKRFNPLDDWYGQSPLEAVGMSVDSHNEATKWNYSVLKNGARPSGALEYQSTLDDTNFTRLKGEIEGSYTGEQRGRPMLLQGGLKWVQMMLSQMDMDWLKGKERSAAEIAVAYNVPEQLVGVPGQQTYNNYREARLALYEDAVLTMLDRYAEALTNWMQQVPEFEGLRIDYDEDQIQALAPRREAMWEKVRTADFLTIDEKRQALGYEPYEPSDEPGAVIFVSAAEIPLGDSVFSTVTEDGTGEALPEIGADGTQLQPQTAGPVQDLALNGAQILAVVQIVQGVVDGTLPPESAIQLLLISFPSLDEAAARALVGPAEEFEPPEEEPPAQPPMMPGVPAAGGQPAQPPRPAQTVPERRVMSALIDLKKRRVCERFEKAYALAYGHRK